MANEAPLDFTIDTTKTATLVPMAAEGQMVPWKLGKLAQGKNDKGISLKWEWDLQAPVQSTEGRPINPGEMGAKMFETISLYDKNTPAGETPEWAARMIAQRQDALLGTGDPSNTKGKPPRPALGPDAVQAMLGKTIVAKMRIGKNQDGSPRSEFGALFFPADIAA